MSQHDPFWQALADLHYWAAILGIKTTPAVVVDNIPEPPLPDWDAERRAIQEKSDGQD